MKRIDWPDGGISMEHFIHHKATVTIICPDPIVREFIFDCLEAAEETATECLALQISHVMNQMMTNGVN